MGAVALPTWGWRAPDSMKLPRGGGSARAKAPLPAVPFFSGLKPAANPAAEGDA